MTAPAADLPAIERLRLHRMVAGDQVEFILNAAAVDELLAEVSAERAARIEAERALKNAAFQFGKHAQAIADVASRGECVLRMLDRGMDARQAGLDLGDGEDGEC